MTNSRLDAEAYARRKAIQNLRVARRYAQQAAEALYDDAGGWAGEAESVRDAADQAISSLSGEPVD